MQTVLDIASPTRVRSLIGANETTIWLDFSRSEILGPIKQSDVQECGRIKFMLNSGYFQRPASAPSANFSKLATTYSMRRCLHRSIPNT
jgi:hypothetical protein